MTLVLAAGRAAPTNHDLFLGVLPLLLLALAVDVYCLRDLVRARSVRYLPKACWALVILCSFPLGALLYMFYGRDGNQGSRMAG